MNQQATPISLFERSVKTVLVTAFQLDENLPPSVAEVKAQRILCKKFPTRLISSGVNNDSISDEAFERLETFYNSILSFADTPRLAVYFRSVFGIKKINQYSTLPTLTVEYFKELVNQ